MKKLPQYILGLTAIAATITACSTKSTTTEMHTAEAVEVSLSKAESNGAHIKVNASGQLQAVESANISTRMMGQVSELLVKSGQQVKKGELLLKISSADLQAKARQVDANIAQAKANFENASKDYERFKSLHQSKSASDKELENMKSRYEMAKAQLKAAKSMKAEVLSQFEYLDIRAPFAGTIGNTFVKKGDMAAPGHPLINLESMGEMEASVMVSEAEISHIKVGQSATVLVKSSNQSLAAKVREVSYSSKNTGGQYLVKLTIETKDEQLFPGMFVNAKIETETASENQNPFIAKSALVHNGQLTGVYTPSESGTAILRWLRLGEKTADKVEVISGLKIGENYIEQASGRLYNGASINFKK